MKVLVPVAAYGTGTTGEYVYRAFKQLGHETTLGNQYDMYGALLNNTHDLIFCVDSGGPFNFFDTTIQNCTFEKLAFWLIDYRHGKYLKNPNDFDTAKYISDRGGHIFQAQIEDSRHALDNGIFNCSWLPLAADPDVWNDKPAEEKIYDIGFVGNCYSDDTEVLTEDGWLQIKDVVDNKYAGNAYTLNMSTQQVELSPVLQHHKRKYVGELLAFSGRSLDLLVTPEHKLVVQRKNKIDFVTAENTPENFKMLAGCKGNVDPSPAHINVAGREWVTTDFMEFVGIFIGDGCVVRRKSQPKNGDFIAISTSIRRKRNVLANLLKKLNIKFNQNNSSITTIYDDRLEDWLDSECGRGALNKHIPKLVWSLGRSALESLWKGLLETDGSGRCYYTSSVSLANDVQRLLMLIGFAGTIGTYVQNSDKKIIIKGKTVKSRSTAYVISKLLPEKRVTVGYGNTRKKSVAVNNVWVYDIGVKTNHTLYVRRNGKAVWSSNCWDNMRAQALESLKNSGLRVGFAGPGGAQMEAGAKILRQSKIGFNISSFFGDNIAYDVNMRFFETLSCGIPLITNEITGIDTVLNREVSKFVRTYRSLAECVDVVLQSIHDEQFLATGVLARDYIINNATYIHRVKDALLTLGK